jgi:glutamine---fructose-6-phosphate transaminase (isomerizing)
MCGVIGINGSSDVISRTMSSLKKLEYRGYDSAGIAYLKDNKIEICRALGKIDQLEKKLLTLNPTSLMSIAHTRWATHGEPSERNAHPHSSDKVSLVHNGTIENSDALKADLLKSGISFDSDTDSEVIVHLIDKFLKQGLTPHKAVREATALLDGSFAILVLFADHPEYMIATKKSSPLVIGNTKKESVISSDLFSITDLVQEICYLEDDDLVLLYKNHYQIFNRDDKKISRELHKVCPKRRSYEKGYFDHFMQKEIFEQPMISKETLDHYIKSKSINDVIPNLGINKIEKIYIIACGTSYFAGLVAKYWLHNILGISTDVEIASEFHYNAAIYNPNNISIFISQSGETADTLKALNDFKKHTLLSIGIVNVTESTIGRIVDVCLPIKAGQEIGVASTKAFTSQLIVLACLTLKAALEKKSITPAKAQHYVDSLLLLPGRISELLNHDQEYKRIASLIVNARSVIYIGRGVSYAGASEGALKLKEISYIHAEAIPAGELKHGSIALIDENVYVVAIAPNDEHFSKAMLNINSVISRKGKVILLSDYKEEELLKKCIAHLHIQHYDIISSPILYNIPLQAISYHTAVLAKNDVDQPRNLAKSVTVE